MATAADHAVGPQVMSSAFYTLAVAVAAWGRYPLALVGVSLAAVALGTSANLSDGGGALRILAINQILNLAVYLGFGWLAMRVGQHERRLRAQRDAEQRHAAQLEEEMMAARAIQSLLFPPDPKYPHVDAAQLSVPARILGGDALFHSASGDGSRVAFGVADVTGKGSPAALLAAVLIGMLDEAPQRHESPAMVLAALNSRLADRLPEGRFITMFYGLIDGARGTLTYANAGHEPAILVRARGGSTEELSPTGMLLGISRDALYTQRRLPLEPGDLVFCYTDGLSDLRTREGEPLGTARLSHLVRTAVADEADSATVIRRVYERALELIAPPSDDVTIVAVRYLGDAEKPCRELPEAERPGS